MENKTGFGSGYKVEHSGLEPTVVEIKPEAPEIKATESAAPVGTPTGPTAPTAGTPGAEVVS